MMYIDVYCMCPYGWFLTLRGYPKSFVSWYDLEIPPFEETFMCIFMYLIIIISEWKQGKDHWIHTILPHHTISYRMKPAAGSPLLLGTRMRLDLGIWLSELILDWIMFGLMVDGPKFSRRSPVAAVPCNAPHCKHHSSPQRWYRRLQQNRLARDDRCSLSRSNYAHGCCFGRPHDLVSSEQLYWIWKGFGRFN